jgi:hypothetical protein
LLLGALREGEGWWQAAKTLKLFWSRDGEIFEVKKENKSKKTKKFFLPSLVESGGRRQKLTGKKKTMSVFNRAAAQTDRSVGRTEGKGASEWVVKKKKRIIFFYLPCLGCWLVGLD